MQSRLSLILIGCTLGAAPLAAQDASLTAPYPPDQCSSCAGWNEPTNGFRLFGNTYYVGTDGLGAILVTGTRGHVLIDGGLPDSAPLIIRNIEALGFRIEDVEIILNSHAHFDHAGGLAALQAASGGTVIASDWSRRAISTGIAPPEDPQAETALRYPAVANVQTIPANGRVDLGDIHLRAIHTGGHTPGGTSWTWSSCYLGVCRSFVYADSLTPVSADAFRFSDTDRYPEAIADFEAGFAALEAVQCDVLVTPHPFASQLWERLAEGDRGLVDGEGCRRYAAEGRRALQRRLAEEAAR